MEFSDQNLEDIFTACILYFGFAVDNASDTTQALQLSVLRLRLSRWGEAIDIYKTPALGDFDPSPEEVSSVRKALVEILSLFRKDDVVVTEAAGGSHSIGNLSGRETRAEHKQLLRTLGDIASERLQRPAGGTSLLTSLGSLRPDSWSAMKSVKAAAWMSALEDEFGSQDLRELASHERSRIEGEAAISCLEAIARGDTDTLDHWIARGEGRVDGHNFLLGNFGFGGAFHVASHGRT
jgi:hypothetical protein